MTRTSLRGVRARVDRIAREAKAAQHRAAGPNWDELVEKLQQGRQMAREGRIAPKSGEECLVRGRELRAQMRAAGMI